MCWYTRKTNRDKEEITECVYKVPCANCDKTYVDETERKFGVRLQEHRTEVEATLHGRSQEVNVCPSYQNTTNPPSPTTRLKRTIWSTGPKRWWSTGSRCDFPGGSKRQYISARKANTLWIGMRAAINSVTHTTAFLTRHLSVVSRTGRTEYLLLLTKASDWVRNVSFS